MGDGVARWLFVVGLGLLTAAPPCACDESSAGRPPSARTAYGTSSSAAPAVSGATAQPDEGPAAATAVTTRSWATTQSSDALPASSSAQQFDGKSVQRGRQAWVRRHYPHVLRAESILREHHARHPELTDFVVLGKSVQGRPIVALAIGRDRQARRSNAAVLLNGAHHGDEPFSSEVVLDAAKQLLEAAGTDPRTDRWLATTTVWCVPLVNPDGFDAFLHNFGAGRKNGRVGGVTGRRRWHLGVDINRNYPFRWGFLDGRAGRSDPEHGWYRGPAPASEPETRAMMQLANREHFVGSISYHAGNVAVLAPYTIDGVRNPEPNEAWLVAERIVRSMPPHPQTTIRLLRNLYPVDGTDQDWLRAEHGTVALLLEASSRSPSAGPYRDAVLDVIRTSWQALLDRYLEGPSVFGYVVDVDGRPVVAEVSVAEIVTHEGESWSTRCRDGRFDRFLPKPGSYTLRIRVPGSSVVERRFEARAGRSRVDVRLRQSVAAASCPTVGRDAGREGDSPTMDPPASSGR